MTNNSSLARSSRWATAVCYGGMTCLAIGANLAPVYLTTFRDAFATVLTGEQQGRIPGVTFAAMVLGIVVSGPLADRWGAKFFAMLGLAATSAGLCALATVTRYSGLLCACAVMGFGGGVLDMVLSPIICAVHPQQRTKALNWLHSFYCIGALAVVLICALAFHFQVSWRAIALGLNVVPLVLFLAFIPLRIPPLVHEDAERTPVKALMTRPFFLAAVIAITLCGATEQGMAQWLPAYAETWLGYDKTVSALALAGFSIGMAIGRGAAGNTAHRIKTIPMLLFACAGCVTCYLVACFFPVSGIALAACVTMGLAVSCLWPNTLSLIADYFPHGGASMFSIMAAGGNVGCFVTPWLIGAIAQQSDIRWGLASATVCPLMLGAIVLGISHRHPAKSVSQ
ncbi:MAG: MFS transporter [Candidatus Hydrogenedentes bacterium]|nr:MFS transporter [Candidatus Hydrogenedentota bacterium]